MAEAAGGHRRWDLGEGYPNGLPKMEAWRRHKYRVRCSIRNRGGHCEEENHGEANECRQYLGRLAGTVILKG